MTACFKCVAQPARDGAHRVCESCHSAQHCPVCERAAVARAAERAAERRAERKAKQPKRAKKK